MARGAHGHRDGARAGGRRCPDTRRQHPNRHGRRHHHHGPASFDRGGGPAGLQQRVRQARGHRRQVRDRAAARAVVGDQERRAGLRLQAAPRREVPRRHRLQCRDREVELRSYARSRPGLATSERDRSGEGRQGRRSLHGRDHALGAVRAVPVGLDRSRRDDGVEGGRREVQGRFRPQPGRHRAVPLRGVGEGRSSDAQALRRVLGIRAAASRRDRVSPHSGFVGALHGDAHRSDRRHASDPSQGRVGSQGRARVEGVGDPEPLVGGDAPQQSGRAVHQQGHSPGDVVRRGPHRDSARGLLRIGRAGMGPVSPEHVGSGS